MAKKKCIFHTPYPINQDRVSGSAVRPKKMFQTFNELYDVFAITGYAKERKERFKQLKKLVASGEKFDFFYSESSTMPNALTEKNHLPLYPFLEKQIFKFCKKNNIPTGLFYRDIYWRFSAYAKSVPLTKRCASTPFYKYDLSVYNRYIDILYLPSLPMNEYVRRNKKIAQLPSGCEETAVGNTCLDNKTRMNIFYVGGVSKGYNMSLALHELNKCEFLDATICCPKSDWDCWQNDIKQNLKPHIKIIHESGQTLEKYYALADISLMFFELIEYRKISMPVKLFEYLQHKKPIITTDSWAGGDFVVDNDIGFAIQYEQGALFDLLTYLNTHRELIEEKRANMDRIAHKHTWGSRALQVETDLMSLSGRDTP